MTYFTSYFCKVKEYFGNMVYFRLFIYRQGLKSSDFWNKIWRKTFIVILIYSRLMSRKLKEIFMLSLNNDLITFYASWITEIQYGTCGKNILILQKLDISVLHFNLWLMYVEQIITFIWHNLTNHIEYHIDLFIIIHASLILANISITLT